MTVWKDYPDTSTPITAAALNDLETRANNALTTANNGIEQFQATSEALTSRVAHMESIETELLYAMPLCPNTRFKAPPAGRPLRAIAYYLSVTTNQYGQALLSLPAGVNGLVNCIVQSCQFDTADANAFADVVALTGAEASTGNPIITITRNGARRASVSTYVSIFGIGW